MNHSLKKIFKSPVFIGIALTWLFVLTFLNCIAIDATDFWQFFTTAFFAKANFSIFPVAAVAPITAILFASYIQYPIKIDSKQGNRLFKIIGVALYVTAILFWAFDTSRPNRDVPYPTLLKLVPGIVSVMYSNATTFGQKTVNFYMVIISPAVILYFGTKLTSTHLEKHETRILVERFLYIILLASAWFVFEIPGNLKGFLQTFFLQYHFPLIFGALIIAALLLVLVKFREEQSMFNSLAKAISGLILAICTAKLPQFIDFEKIPKSSRFSLILSLIFASSVLIVCLYYLTYIVTKRPETNSKDRKKDEPSAAHGCGTADAEPHQ